MDGSISISSPTKIGESVQGYYVYPITSQFISANKENQGSITVNRRYSDFYWLHEKLTKECPGCIIPPLPEKTLEKAMGMLQDSEFLEKRRIALSKFLQRVMKHHMLSLKQCWIDFLHASNAEFLAMKSSSQSPSSVSKESLTNWFGKTYQKISENSKVKTLAAKAGKEIPNQKTDEDLEFDKIMTYVTLLHTKVKNLQARVSAVHKQKRLLASSLSELAVSITMLAEFESGQPEMKGIDLTLVEPILVQSSNHGYNEMSKLLDEITDYARLTNAALNALRVREDRRFAYQAEVAAATKQAQNESTCKFQKENIISQPRVVEARLNFEEVHHRVILEITRFRQEKGNCFIKMFRDFAHLQASLHQDMKKTIDFVLSNVDKNMGKKEEKQVSPPPFSISNASDLESFLHSGTNSGYVSIEERVEVHTSQFADVDL